MVAKVLALMALALLAVVASIVSGAAGNVLADVTRDTDGSWGDASTLGRGALFQVLSVLIGVGLGMLLLNAPVAIVAYLLLPIIFSSLADIVTALATRVHWLNPLETFTRLLGDPLTGTVWAQIAASFALWCLLPLLLGAVRVHRREVQ